jgi:hypothetical protein
MDLHTSGLDELCHDISRFGGNINDPYIIEKYGTCKVVYNTFVDQNISPFSQEYFDQQL